MRHALLASLAALLLLAPGVQAQDIPSPYRYIETTQSVSAFAGWLATDRGDLEIGPHSAPLFGASYQIRFSGPVAGEVLLGLAPSQRTVHERTSAAGDSVELEPVGEVDAFLLTAQAGLRFQVTGPRTWNGLAPYLVAGVGMISDLNRIAEVEEELEPTQIVDLGPGFAVSIGAGTDWFLSERLSLRLEARDHLWRLGIPEGFTRQQQEEHEWTHNLGVTLGLAFHF